MVFYKLYFKGFIVNLCYCFYLLQYIKINKKLYWSSRMIYKLLSSMEGLCLRVMIMGAYAALYLIKFDFIFWFSNKFNWKQFTFEIFVLYIRVFIFLPLQHNITLVQSHKHWFWRMLCKIFSILCKVCDLSYPTESDKHT